jgi:hypothetical protein
MAYGLRYTLSQILKNGNNQVLEIYEEDYVGSVKTYIPTSISLKPNSSNEYPYPAIISTQLEFTFILETEDDYNQYPNVISSNDRLYFVLLKEGSDVIWRGYLFNDYSEVGFSTGISQSSLIAIDGISFLKNQEYVVDNSINSLAQHLDIIAIALRYLAYPSDLYLTIACSFFADGMQKRDTNIANEPFSQIYQYRRDFVDESYYVILEKILRTFNCRMYQANGDWYISATMETAASVRYFTRYAIGASTITVQSSGAIDNTINIAPYANNNVHFIDNSQTKILRKGFFNIEARSEYKSPINLIHNANLKIISGTAPNITAQGWRTTLTSNATASVVVDNAQQFNEYNLVSNAGVATLEILQTILPYTFTPYMGGTPITFSCEHKNLNNIQIQIALLETGAGNKYLDNNGVWQTNSNTYITFPAATKFSNFETFTLEIPPFYTNFTSPYEQFLMGYINVKIRCDDSSTYLKNFKLIQGNTEVKYAVVQFNSSPDQSTAEVFEQPYGQIYPNTYGQQVLTFGSLYNSSGIFLTGWNFQSVGLLVGGVLPIQYLAYQYIKIYNRNIATLEADLGAIKGTNGYVYLDKVFTVTDSSTGNLSYNGKKFTANRLTLNPYADETNSLQLIEIYYDESLIFLIPTYITDVGQLGPFWNLNFDINL